MFCTEDREDNSPGLPRRKRPLSMVLEENHDEDDKSVENDDDDNDNKESGQNYQPPHPPDDNASRHASTDSDDKEAEPVKKTRRRGVSYQQPPSFITQLGDDTTPTSSPNHTPQSQRRLFTPPSQRKVSENTLRLRHKVSDTNEGTDSESEGDSFVTRLKDTATKLNLKTRRQSYLTWRAKYVEEPRDLPKVKVVTEDDGRLTKERKEKMDNDLRWIREQLVDLRRQDRSLARQLLGIRQELSTLRLAVSCEEHQELLDDAQDEMEDLRELSRFVDFPIDMLSASPLRQIGVTKMNLSSRRFSTC